MSEPTTFERHVHEGGISTCPYCQSAYAAGVASQQAEIERLNEALRVYQQSINWQSAPDLAKLSAVVEAAREEHTVNGQPKHMASEGCPVCTALAALDEGKVAEAQKPA